jgi:hypothetical protein
MQRMCHVLFNQRIFLLYYSIHMHEANTCLRFFPLLLSQHLNASGLTVNEKNVDRLMC